MNGKTEEGNQEWKISLIECDLGEMERVWPNLQETGSNGPWFWEKKGCFIKK